MALRRLQTLCIAVLLLAALPALGPAAEEGALPRDAGMAAPAISLNEAILKTLQANPSVSIEKETVLQGEGLLEQASGAFDVVATSQLSTQRARTPLDQATERTVGAQAAFLGQDPPDQVQKETKVFSVGATKLARSGVSVTPSATTTDSYDTSTGKPSQNVSTLNFNITVPLLRNLGQEATGADELAQESRLQAARYTTRHNIAQLINLTAASYWACLASRLSFELTMDTQRRSQKLLNLVENLVKAGSLEPAALNQARANLLSNQVDVRGQQEALYTSRQTLAVSMGLTPREMPQAPNPTGDFPQVPPAASLAAVDIRPYIDGALKQRGDYLGAQRDIETAQILLRQAENQLKPKLDLGLNAGYTGLKEGASDRYYASLGNKLRGVNYLVTLSLELPVQNRAAKGNLAVKRSQARVAEMALQGLANQIASETLVAYEGLLAAAHEVQLAEEAEGAYGKAVEFENQKYMSGGSTLTAVIDVEGRYFNARVKRIDVLRKYATALAHFRFVTGSLLDHREGPEQFEMARLLAFPQAGNTPGKENHRWP